MSFNTPGQYPPFQSVVLQLIGTFGQDVVSSVPQVIWNDNVHVISGSFDMEANDTDVACILPTFNSLKWIFFWDDDKGTDLSLKYNSETTVAQVKPYTGRGGTSVTQVVVTNANTTIGKRLNWLAIDYYERSSLT